MSDSRSPLDPDLAALLDSRRDGCGMPRAFYATEALYAAELQRVWQARVAVRRIRVRDPEPRRFPDAVRRPGAGAGDSRRRRPRARVPQRLPPSRLADLPHRQRSRPRPGLPVPQLDLFAAGRARRLPRHARRHRQVDARLEAAARRGRRRPHLRFARRGAARVRGFPPALRGRGRAAGLRSRAHRARDRVRGRRELEARLGEQPRVLSLHAAPPAVREIELRRLRGGARLAGGTAADRRRDRAHRVEVGGAGRRRRASEGRPRHVSGSRARPLVHVQPHRARRGLRDRIAGRHARRAADGRLPRRRRRRAADAQPAQLLAARELRPRGRDADAAGRPRAGRG